MDSVKVATWSDVPERTPVGATVEGIDLVVIRRGDEHSVLYGRCLHRGALLADGRIEGDDLLCGLHGWDYRIDTGVSAYNNSEVLQKFTSMLEGGDLVVDRDEILRFKMRHPQPFDPDVYQGYFRDPHMVVEEPFVMYIHELAANGLSKTGMHGPVGAMGVRARSSRSGTASNSSLRNWRVCPSSTTRSSAPKCASDRMPTNRCGSTSPSSCRT